MSADAVEVRHAGARYFNRYAYTANNPFNYTDPDGNAAQALEIGALGAVALCLRNPACVSTVGGLLSGAGGFALGYNNEAAEGGASDAPLTELESGTDELISDREPGTDGKRGSTGGPGAGKRFRPETPSEREDKEGVPCAYCGTETTNERGHPNSRERDHIDPKSRGGNNSSENERDACRTCNRSKGARNPDEWAP